MPEARPPHLAPLPEPLRIVPRGPVASDTDAVRADSLDVSGPDAQPLYNGRAVGPSFTAARVFSVAALVGSDAYILLGTPALGYIDETLPQGRLLHLVVNGDGGEVAALRAWLELYDAEVEVVAMTPPEMAAVYAAAEADPQIAVRAFRKLRH